MKQNRKIVRDGEGYGVIQLSRTYGTWDFLNDEPFPSEQAVRAWLKSHDKGKNTNWEVFGECGVRVTPGSGEKG